MRGLNENEERVMTLVIDYANIPGPTIALGWDELEPLIKRGSITLSPCPNRAICHNRDPNHAHYFATAEGRSALEYTRLARLSSQLGE
jgi:hypothetical protein